jgi:hypothetical protein
MTKDPWWKREIKEILAISSVFFVIFVLFLLMKKVLLDEYYINFYIVGTAFVGSLIIAKVVLIFDLLPLSKRMDHLPNIYRVFFRSFVYLLGFVIFTFIEGLIKGLIDKESFSHAMGSAFHELSETTFITSMVGVFVAFLFFNTFWVIRAKYGPTALYALFFKKENN